MPHRPVTTSTRWIVTSFERDNPVPVAVLHCPSLELAEQHRDKAIAASGVSGSHRFVMEPDE